MLYVSHNTRKHQLLFFGLGSCICTCLAVKASCKLGNARILDSALLYRLVARKRECANKTDVERTKIREVAFCYIFVIF